jgi:hypothetical protein
MPVMREDDRLPRLAEFGEELESKRGSRIVVSWRFLFR